MCQIWKCITSLILSSDLHCMDLSLFHQNLLYKNLQRITFIKRSFKNEQREAHLDAQEPYRMLPAGCRVLSAGDLGAEKGFQPEAESPSQLNIMLLNKSYENEIPQHN